MMFSLRELLRSRQTPTEDGLSSTAISQLYQLCLPTEIHEALGPWISQQIFRDEMLISSFEENGEQRRPQNTNEFFTDFIERLKYIQNSAVQNYLHTIQNLDSVDWNSLYEVISEKWMYEQHKLDAVDNHGIENRIKTWYTNIRQCIQYGDLVRLIGDLEEICKDIVSKHLLRWKRSLILTDEYRVFGSLERLKATYFYRKFGPWQVDLDAKKNIHEPLEILDQVQIWFTNILAMVSNLITIINNVQENPTNADDLDKIRKKIYTLLQEVLQSGFVVDKQPPQHIKTKTNFDVSVRFLFHEMAFISKEVKVSIGQENALNDPNSLISSCDAITIGDTPGNKSRPPKVSLLRFEGEYCQCKIEKMQLSKIARTKQENADNAAEEIYVLLFQTTINLFNMTFQIRTKSLPVAVSVHTTQEPIAWSSIKRHFAYMLKSTIYGLNNQRPMYSVHWSDWEIIMNFEFISETSRALSPDNLRFLFNRMFPTEEYNRNRIIKWEDICNDLPEKNFSFLEWFYNVVKLTSHDDIRKHWCAGRIIGFITKAEAAEKLRGRPAGTFLLRYGDNLYSKNKKESKFAGIAGVVVNDDGLNIHIEPQTKRELVNKSFDEIILNNAMCSFLYPDNIAKARVFEFTPKSVTVGYTSWTDSTTNSSASMRIDNPSTSSASSDSFTSNGTMNGSTDEISVSTGSLSSSSSIEYSDLNTLPLIYHSSSQNSNLFHDTLNGCLCSANMMN